MRRSLSVLFLLSATLLAAAAAIAQGPADHAAQATPSIIELTPPSPKVPAAGAPDATAAPLGLAYIGPEGGFLLHSRSRGIFRWGDHWASSMSYRSDDANYYYYQMDGSNGCFAFAKNASGGTYVVFKGLDNAGTITWQDLPNGWMRATRGPAKGNLQ